MNIKQVFPLLIIACMHAKAADLGLPHWLGVEVFRSNPTGMLNTAYTSSAGTGAGVFIAFDMENGHEIRWDINASTTFPKKLQTDINGNTASIEFASESSTLSYAYHLNGSHYGPYVMAGLGVLSFHASADYPNSTAALLAKQDLGGDAIPTHTKYVCSSGPKLAFLIGGGYDFGKHWGVTARYKGIRSLGHTLATLEGGVNYRF